METTDNTIIKLRLPTFLTILVAVISITFSVSGFYFTSGAITEKVEAAIKTLDEKIDASNERMVEEVGGLRSDWERRNDDVDRRLEKVEK